MDERKIYRDTTNIKTLFVCFFVFVLGAVIILLPILCTFIEPWKTIFRDFGSVIIASVSIAVIWDFVSKRPFLKEVLSATKLAEEIEETGLTGISPQWHGKVEWKDLFLNSKELRIFFIYGSTWKNSNRGYLIDFANRPSTKATIVLPDYEDIELIKRIAIEVGYSVDELITKIKDSEADFIKIFENKKKLTIWHTSVFPIYSYYGFDHSSIVTFYSLDRDKVEVPTLFINSTGSLEHFFRKDFTSMLSEKDGLSKKFFPSKK
jgi:hypothetical protein